MQNLAKTPAEIEKMRESGRMLGQVLRLLKKSVAAGMQTRELDDIARQEIKALGGKPAFYGYHGFPAAACISVNSEVVHGIPSTMELHEGDIISIDCGVDFRGMITDAAFSKVIGSATAEQKKLISKTEEALYAGIKQVKDGVPIGNIGSAIQKVLDQAELGIVRDLVGHGVGRVLHEEPEVPNFGQAGSGPRLKAGMTIAIEPMATLGDWKVRVNPDGWTIATKDNSLSAHFEHSILVTDSGSEILTLHD